MTQWSLVIAMTVAAVTSGCESNPPVSDPPDAPGDSAPGDSYVTLAASLVRFDGQTGPVVASYGVPLPRTGPVAALSDEELLTMRLFRTDTGEEIPTSVWRLKGRRRALGVQFDFSGDTLPPIEYRFNLVSGLERRAQSATTAIPAIAGWPSNADDLCSAELVGGPLVPYATRGTLPSPYTILDDDYARAHEKDFAITEAEYQAWVAGTGTPGQAIFLGRNSVAYDAMGTGIAEGSRRGGIDGHTWMWRAIVRVHRYLEDYVVPNNGLSPEHAVTPHAIPGAYWLTADEYYRRGAVLWASGQVLMWGDVSWKVTNYQPQLNSGSPRRLANVVRPLLDAARLEVTYDEFPDLPQAASPVNQTTFSAQMDALLAAYEALGRTSGQWKGNWGGSQFAGQSVTDSTAQAAYSYDPGAPGVTMFQLGFLLGELVDCLREDSIGQPLLSEATATEMRQYILDALDYYQPQVSSFPTGGFSYIYPFPSVYPDFNWMGNVDDGDPALNGFWVLPFLYGWSATGATGYRDFADDLMLDLVNVRLPNGVIGAWYDSWQYPSVRKNFDEAYVKNAAALGLRNSQ